MSMTEEQIAEVARVINDFIDVTTSDTQHEYDSMVESFNYSWDDAAWRDGVLNDLRAYSEVGSAVERAIEAGVSHSAIMEAAKDYAKVFNVNDYRRGSKVVIESLYSGEQEFYLDDYLQDNLDDQIIDNFDSFFANIDQQDVDDINDLLKRKWICTVRKSGDGLVVDIDLGIELEIGLDRAGVENFEERLSEMTEEAENDIASKIEQLDTRGPATDNIVYRVKHPKFQGCYVAKLPANALGDEGEQMGICVGDPEQGYIAGVHRGTTAIMSLRKPNGNSLMTFEFSLSKDGSVRSCNQVKGKANRLPGYDKASDGKFIKPAEVELAVEVLGHFNVRPGNVSDMSLPLRSYENSKQQVQPTASFAEAAHSNVHCGFCRRPVFPAADSLDAVADMIEASHAKGSV
jgi:hypothetical protein